MHADDVATVSVGRPDRNGEGRTDGSHRSLGKAADCRRAAPPIRNGTRGARLPYRLPRWRSGCLPRIWEIAALVVAQPAAPAPTAAWSAAKPAVPAAGTGSSIWDMTVTANRGFTAFAGVRVVVDSCRMPSYCPRPASLTSRRYAYTLSSLGQVLVLPQPAWGGGKDHLESRNHPE